jgi:hypothetical protein
MKPNQNCWKEEDRVDQQRTVLCLCVCRGGSILFAGKGFVEEGDEFWDVELDEAEVEELDLCLLHFEKIIEFQINLK